MSYDFEVKFKIRKCIVCEQWFKLEETEEVCIGTLSYQEIIRRACNKCIKKIYKDDK